MIDRLSTIGIYQQYELRRLTTAVIDDRYWSHTYTKAPKRAPWEGWITRKHDHLTERVHLLHDRGCLQSNKYTFVFFFITSILQSRVSLSSRCIQGHTQACNYSCFFFLNNARPVVRHNDDVLLLIYVQHIFKQTNIHNLMVCSTWVRRWNSSKCHYTWEKKD